MPEDPNTSPPDPLSIKCTKHAKASACDNITVAAGGDIFVQEICSKTLVRTHLQTTTKSPSQPHVTPQNPAT